ncbi:Hypoxia-inducible lipid droplet-associated protein [Microtus ochrogaster]|uniref:Hypoxia-inducible lipid droplet-associated protein n=1 Tax=Microtus ochrogaster TaxID=79684 RepID=A0A8J6GCJ3_MICOH|nr:Hypoxia-inducible lipid droplet-associated protein [Microtus ochrogaster]
MKYMLNLYLLGVMLTLLSIFVRLMESVGALLESPVPGSPWIAREHIQKRIAGVAGASVMPRPRRAERSLLAYLTWGTQCTETWSQGESSADTQLWSSYGAKRYSYLKPRAEEERRVAAEEKKRLDELKRIERERAEAQDDSILK